MFFRSLLEQHMHCHREMVSVKVFECPEKGCLFSGRSAAELRVHQVTHSDEKNYQCTVENCSYKTKTNALLNRSDRKFPICYKVQVFKRKRLIKFTFQTYQVATSKRLHSVIMSPL